MANPVNKVKKTGQEKKPKPDIKVTEGIQDRDKRTHPVYIRDERTGKCYLIRFSRFVFPWESENRYISFCELSFVTACLQPPNIRVVTATNTINLIFIFTYFSVILSHKDLEM